MTRKVFWLLLITVMILFFSGFRTCQRYNLNQNKFTTLYQNFKKNNPGVLTCLSILPTYNNFNQVRDQFIKLINLIPDHPELSYIKKDKVSVKLTQIGSDLKQRMANFKIIIKEAQKKGVMIWISASYPEERHQELQIYQYFRKNGYDNLGLTVATYNSDADDLIDQVLYLRGHVRLVKGFYWSRTSSSDILRSYLFNAKRLINDGKYHCLATHDFKLLDQLEFPSNHQIEFSFFSTKEKEVLPLIKKRKYIQLHSYFLAQGSICSYLPKNIWRMNWIKASSNFV